jgi:hypothetical protein
MVAKDESQNAKVAKLNRDCNYKSVRYGLF